MLINIVLSHLSSHVTPGFVTWCDTVTMSILWVVFVDISCYKDLTKTKGTRRQERAPVTGNILSISHEIHWIWWFVLCVNVWIGRVREFTIIRSFGSDAWFKKLSLLTLSSSCSPKTISHYFQILFKGSYFNKARILLHPNISVMW